MVGAGAERAAARVAPQVAGWLDSQLPKMQELLEHLARIETPSREPDVHAPLFTALASEFESIGYRTRRLPGRVTGGALYARPAQRRRSVGAQLLLGHADTVWPRSTVAQMPVESEDGRMRGPGVYDMKAGLVQMLFALRALAQLELTPPLEPHALVNSDEEIGSRESTRHIRRLARSVQRAFVLEPSLGLDGRLKTARKGVGRFVVTVRGRAAHAGLDPETGVSAILELSHVIQKLFDLNDVERGISVNVGTIDGGLGANIVAPESQAIVDVRVRTGADAARIEREILSLRATTEGAELDVQGGIGRPPMEPTPGNQRLWESARVLALQLGIPLEQAAAGGGSDGNTTSAYVPTLDGLGAVGDGAHARHEFVFTEKLAERAALLALLLLVEPQARENTR